MQIALQPRLIFQIIRCVCISVTIFQENFTYIMYTAMLKFDLRFIVDIMDLKKTKQNKTKQTK